MWRVRLFVALLLLALGAATYASKSSMKPHDLRCEFRKEPLGVDASKPRLSWVLQASSGARNLKQSAYRILVASSTELLTQNRGDLWDSGKVSSSEQNNVVYEGALLKSGQTCFWKVQVWDGKGTGTWSASTRWEMGLLRPKDWEAQWLNDGKISPATDAGFYQDDPAPLFRKEFQTRGTIKRARLYITGLGYYEATINGKLVGDHVLDPGWTVFDKRVNYSVYDVTRELKKGSNCLGVMLGNGWYNSLPLRLFGSFNLREHVATGRPRLIAQLHIEYRDGTSETVASNQTWKVGDGPILRNNIYLGEVYDARKELPEWDRPGFDDSQWRTPAVATENVGTLIAQPQPPIRVTEHWNAVKVTEPKPGTFIYDLGVNFAGWAKLKFDLPRGTKVQLRYGELLREDGTLNPMTSVAGQIKGNKQGTTESIGGPGAPTIAWQGDTYISGGGPETYTPRFTFHGFRYLEIIGLDKPLPLGAVTAQRLNSDVEDAGTFECSNPMLNEIQAMCRRTFESNIFSVQSDCPHRERLAYGGDIVATSESLMFNYDMAGFYEKAVRDWSDSALPNGMFTDTAPFMGIQYCGVVWAMAPPLLADQLHRYYGNRQIGKEEYEAAKRWLLLVDAQYPEGIVTNGLSDHESLQPTPSAELVTPMYFQCAKILATMASRLSRSEDVTRFERLATKIRDAYQAKFIDPKTGKVGPGTQTSQAIALHTGIIPDSTRSKVLSYLVQEVEKRNGHLATGILGTKFMLDALSRNGQSDLAYRIVTQPTFPGWGWMLKNGATTLWEHWEFSDNTFSHNHPMFGSVSQWMMNWLGGIQPHPDAIGFDRILIRPQTPKGLDWVKSSYKSVRGKIVSNWSRQGKSLKFEISIPPNVSAQINLPAASVKSISEDGKPLAWPAQQGPHGVEFSLGSGDYKFTVSSEPS